MNEYYDYERKLGRDCVSPALEREGISLSGKAVLEVGCGYGGVLAGLRERFAFGSALGIDVDREMIETARRLCPTDIELEPMDFLEREMRRGFDVIVMRDVLEHIVDVEAALRRALALLRPKGVIYVSFAPFYSPFGGHQHLGSGLFSKIPWLHLLPRALFRRLLRLEGSSYKSRDATGSDLESVLRTRLTLTGFRRLVAKLNLRVSSSNHYLLRPDYQFKFGVRPLLLPRVPVLDELLCTGLETILRPT